MGEVAIVIAAYNEADNIAEVVRRAKKYGDVFVVDDCSTDDTFNRAMEAGAVTLGHFVNLHIRKAFFTGFKHVIHSRKYDRIIQMDAGLSHFPEDIPAILKALETNDYVIGTRYKAKQPLFRKILSRVGTFLVGLPYKDVTGGFKGYRLGPLNLMDKVKSRMFAFQFEFTYHIHKAGFRITEVPIRYEYTTSSLKLKVIWEAFITMIRLRTVGR